MGMLDLELVERGALEVDVEPLRLNRLLESEVEQIREDNPQLDITFEAPEDIVVESDQARVSWIVRILLENAARYAGARPIRVILRPSAAGGATVTVRDRGAGIPAELQSGLFQRRYVVDGETRYRSGLGLYLAARLAGRLEAALAFEPQDEGAAFTLTLPAAPHGPS